MLKVGAALDANELSGNTDYALLNRPGGGIDATHNYWGATNESAIQAAIYDELDEPGLGLVDYSPWVAKLTPIDPVLPGANLT